jgi:demethylmenaquinone methyltransferase/2-methoxy-6-polyprenyl-1,4-benzoquinol methylase
MPFNHFNFVARWYDRLIPPVEDGRLAVLLAAEPRQIVLDVGGGTGRHARLLAENDVRVIVCDASPGMAGQAHAKGLSAVLCDVTRLPFASGSADRVLVVDAFHHFVAPSPELAQPAAAQELLRALATRGRMVIEESDVTHRSVRLIVWMERLLRMGSRFLTPRQLAALFQAAGARRVDVHLNGMNAQLVIERRA